MINIRAPTVAAKSLFLDVYLKYTIFSCYFLTMCWGNQNKIVKFLKLFSLQTSELGLIGAGLFVLLNVLGIWTFLCYLFYILCLLAG
jgi:hypothetical protein